MKRNIAILVLIVAGPVFGQPIILQSPTPLENARFGGSLSAVPDVDGDGFDDLVVGSWWSYSEDVPGEAQRAFIFNASTGALIQTFSSPNEEMDGFFGYSVAGVPDLNGNGRGDVVVGAYQESPGSSPLVAGRAYIFDGSTGALLRTLQSPNEQQAGLFGRAVGTVGDLNGNGINEIIVGAERDGSSPSPDFSGRAYVFDGQTGALIHTLESPNAEMDGNFGNAVDGVPDLNGDGIPDLVIGARQESPESSPGQSGRAYTLNGATGDHLRTLSSPDEQQYGNFGQQVAGTDHKRCCSSSERVDSVSRITSLGASSDSSSSTSSFGGTGRNSIPFSRTTR